MSIESRAFPRKVLRCPAQLLSQGIPPLAVRTIDISMGGASLMVHQSLNIGRTVLLQLETMVNGRMCRLNTSAKIVYSILSGTDGFRNQLDAANAKVLGELMA